MSEAGIHDLVKLHADSTPDSLALVSGTEQVTYGELNSRANKLSSFLRLRGVGPDVPVAICMERSVDLPIAAFGVLKSGGAYLPLDPTYPARRLSMLLEDSGTRLVITQSHVASSVPEGKWRTIVLADVLGASLDSATPPPIITKLETLAYIIFTSGSTGRPKGVQISHGNLLNLVRWHQRAFGITSADRAILQASPGFDAAVWETWPYLAAGATLYVADENVRVMPDKLRDWIVSNGITITFLPTVIAESLIDLQWPRQSSFRVLLTGADTLRRRPPQGLPFSLVNNYGPTECTVVATSGKIIGHSSGNQPSSADLPSIGQPIDNVSVYVVDEKLQRVPDGTPGELLIGGLGVGRGYLNSPALNAEKFLPDNFSAVSGARLYRTGDLGRVLPDGQIAFIGRIDDQIKVMGHRIEPNEIVTVLNRHPRIDTSYVCSYRDASGSQRLVAYIVVRDKTTATPTDLRNFLGSYLPSHMVPATFVQMTHLPLSTHGKLDRTALPQPTEGNTLRDEMEEEFQSPIFESPIEERLSAMLSTLLGVSHVGSNDNFFTLGGHSLMGAQLIAKVRESFGVELSLRALFEEPTTRGMSAEIERLIYARLATMSEDEAQRLLASSSPGL